MFNVLEKTVTPAFDKVDMKARQTPLTELYAEDPAEAIVIDHGRCTADVDIRRV